MKRPAPVTPRASGLGTDHPMRDAVRQITRIESEWSTLERTVLSIGMAAFLGAMAQVSFPVPWTPVPFSLMPFALLLAGATQRPGFAALSVLLYLAAGALGLPVYAEGSSGWHHLVGATGGYLVGFVAAGALASAYMRRPRRMLTGPWLVGLAALFALATLGGMATIAWMWTWGGSGIAEDWGVTASTMWVLVGATLAAGGASWWVVRRRAQGIRYPGEETAASPAPATWQRAGNLFFAYLGCILVIHAFGVPVLWLLTPLDLISAIALGSIVFLPFDMVKAALAVALTLPFQPGDPADA